MCGWVGYVTRPGDPAGAGLDHAAIIKAMADTIVHRGPDDDGYYLSPPDPPDALGAPEAGNGTEAGVGAVPGAGAALGFRRLSIIDLEGGHQPILNEDGTRVLVFNGEIYNYQPLREQLIAAGHVFTTLSDSEVVLHGYEQWGQDVLTRLRGMFSFAIWDQNTRTLFGAHDIFGIKPLYYYTGNEQFLCGSEIKSFLAHPGFVKEVNEARLPEYLCFEYVPGPQTMFRDVFKLGPGECFTWQDGQLTVSTWFDFRFRPDRGKTMEQWVEVIRETFTASVAAHKIADVEVGCFLSSGVDSSYATSELAKIQDVRTFSVGYAEEKYSELRYAQQYSALIGVQNISNTITAADFFGAVGDIQYHMDEPLPNPSAVPLYFLARSAAKHVKVVLSGEGADELFGGYNSYLEPLSYEPYQKVVPAALRRGLGRLAERMPAVRGRRFLIRAAQPIEQRFFRHTYNFTAEERDSYLAKPANAPHPSTFTKKWFDKVAGADDLTKMQYVDFYTWLASDILLKADKMSMASSLELRVPFLDREVLAVALALPTAYRIRKGTTKAALREAANRSLPDEVANKPKLGFPVPLDDWLREPEHYEQVRAMFASEAAARFFDREAILSLLERHRAGEHLMKKVWTVYCFLLWHEEFFVRR